MYADEMFEGNTRLPSNPFCKSPYYKVRQTEKHSYLSKEQTEICLCKRLIDFSEYSGTKFQLIT